MIAAISARMLIATLCLLACATSASAECAWVLWTVSATVVVATGETRALPAEWSPYAGFAHAQACVTAEAAAVRADQARGKDWSEVVQNVELRHTFIYRASPTPWTREDRRAVSDESRQARS